MRDIPRPEHRASAADVAIERAIQVMRTGHVDEAEARLVKVLEGRPEHVNATKLLAECAATRGETDRALTLLERCLELAPRFDAARFRCAALLQMQLRLDEAARQISTLVERDPKNRQYRALQASILGQGGESDRSLAILEALVREQPDDAPAWTRFAHALKVAGKRDSCVAAYRKVIELQPQSGDGYWGLANLKTFRFTQEDIAGMTRQLARGDLRAQTRAQFHFALGKAHEDREEYDTAFKNYKLGNALWRTTIAYDADETHAFVEATEAILTREFFETRRGNGNDARDPIFIVGMPRAGSTLVEQILSSHSQIEGTMELPHVPALARRLNEADIGRRNPYPAGLAEIGAAELEHLGAQYVRDTTALRKLRRPYFIDKMPNNYAHIGLIHLILPNARIIDARRHPLACCFSNYKQLFERGQDFTYSLTDLGRYYRDYASLMAHWDRVLPGKVHRLAYEDLVRDPATEIRRLLDYLGLPFEEACLRFHENERAVRTSSSEQVREPLNRNAVDQWRNFEPWLGPLKSELGHLLDAADREAVPQKTA